TNPLTVNPVETSGSECAIFLIMDDSRIHERLQRMREKTEQAIRGSEELMRQSRLLIKQSQTSCRASRALLEALEESLLLTGVDLQEPGECSSAPNHFLNGETS